MEQLNFFNLIKKNNTELTTAKEYWDIISWFEDMKSLNPSKVERNEKFKQAIDYFTPIACTLEALEANRKKEKEQDKIIHNWDVNKGKK